MTFMLVNIIESAMESHYIIYDHVLVTKSA